MVRSLLDLTMQAAAIGHDFRRDGGAFALGSLRRCFPFPGRATRRGEPPNRDRSNSQRSAGSVILKALRLGRLPFLIDVGDYVVNRLAVGLHIQHLRLRRGLIQQI
jgi:hypothetical protein